MNALPRLRHDLDFMPSPIEDTPGLLIRDSLHYSDAVIVIPPALVSALACFDGKQTQADLRGALVNSLGTLEVSGIIESIVSTLSRSAFLEDEAFYQLRETCRAEFAGSAVRQPAHAGTGYPDTPDELKTVMSEYLADAEAAPLAHVPVAIAAPHVSPQGGWESYRAAYSALPSTARDRTFVILGTSHYGEPDRFGLTAKPFATPFGTTRTAPDLLKRLERQPAAIHEDYCHAVEHSIEFQVVFLQSLFGPDICVLPILVGSFGRSIHQGRAPETNEGVNSFLGALAELHARESHNLLWVLGVDMAHMGRRYGDHAPALAHEDAMQRVEERDLARIEALTRSDSRAFWDLVKENNEDDLKWCGSAPIYTFLKTVPDAVGTLRKYEQWNIDQQSIVSFAGITFDRP